MQGAITAGQAGDTGAVLGQMTGGVGQAIGG